MPDAPAPMPVLSRTTMRSEPWPTVMPLARRRPARCIAVERPWMPAPMMTYAAWEGSEGMGLLGGFVDLLVGWLGARRPSILPKLRRARIRGASRLATTIPPAIYRACHRVEAHSPGARYAARAVRPKPAPQVRNICSAAR